MVLGKLDDECSPTMPSFGCGAGLKCAKYEAVAADLTKDPKVEAVNKNKCIDEAVCSDSS